MAAHDIQFIDQDKERITINDNQGLQLALNAMEKTKSYRFYVVPIDNSFLFQNNSGQNIPMPQDPLKEQSSAPTIVQKTTQEKNLWKNAIRKFARKEVKATLEQSLYSLNNEQPSIQHEESIHMVEEDFIPKASANSVYKPVHKNVT